jgi:hypothetical protein
MLNGVKCVMRSALPTGALDGARVAVRTVGGGSERLTVDSLRVLGAPAGQPAREALADQGVVLRQSAEFTVAALDSEWTHFELAESSPGRMPIMWMTSGPASLDDITPRKSTTYTPGTVSVRLYRYANLTVAVFPQRLSAAQLEAVDRALGKPVAER